ncbi:response regulator transcription factor, partial [bacterium]|nr:response regulator transcription factor [bacterium]
MLNPPIKLLLVEDHKLMRVGLKSLFEDKDGLEVTSEAENGAEAIEKFRTNKPDVTLMDIGLPDMSGIEATKKILEHNTGAKIIML